MGNGHPRSRSRGSPIRARASLRGRSFSACPGSGPTATTSLPRRSSAAPWRWSASARSASACPRWWCPTCARRWARAAARFYGDPTRELDVVGITGTNGKTTTAFLVRHLLEADGRQTGLLGTVKPVVGGVRGGGRAHHARGDRPAGHLPRGCSTPATAPASMEVSSHALELGRAAGIHFACRVFTNLTQDHLDFHPTMEDYFAAKRRLFEGPGPGGGERGRRRGAAGSRRSAGRPPPSRSSARPTTGRATCASTSTGSALHAARRPDGAARARARRCPACSTCRTSLAAVAAARARSACRWRRSRPRCRGFGRVPGRFEPVDEGQDFGVLVDYAHTPDSLENVLRAARELTQRAAARGVRRRRRPRPRQAPADGRRGARAWPTARS